MAPVRFWEKVFNGSEHLGFRVGRDEQAFRGNESRDSCDPSCDHLFESQDSHDTSRDPSRSLSFKIIL